MFFNNTFNTFFGLNLTLVYTFPMCMAWRFHFPIRNYDFNVITHRPYRPYSRCQSLKPSLVFLNRASYGRRRNNDVTSQEREVTMMLRHNLRTDAQICGKSASQASIFVRHGRGVNRVYCFHHNAHLTSWRTDMSHLVLSR